MFGNKKKLSLNKETVRALSGTEMQGLVGGFAAVRGLNPGIVMCTDNCECTKTCNTCGCAGFNFGAVVLPAKGL